MENARGLNLCHARARLRLAGDDDAHEDEDEHHEDDHALDGARRLPAESGEKNKMPVEVCVAVTINERDSGCCGWAGDICYSLVLLGVLQLFHAFLRCLNRLRSTHEEA